MDTMVLATQKWLNKTYGSVANYKQVPETGNTGWPTIYGLIRGVQHELGIALQDGSPAFGEATSAAFDAKVVPNLKKGYKSNFVYLIQGAFWVKGISPEEFTGTYSSYTELAIKSLQSDAGIPTTGVLDSQLAQALFDMSAFVLVSGGDSNVRQMQQYLNANYRQYTGILPTDGIYQRATNTALIYGVQAELGLGDIANGFWGPTTISTYKSAFSNGLGDKVIKLIQYALYVNMKEYLTTKGAKGPAFTGALDSSTQNILSQFQNFMMLDPVKTGQPDSTTMYSLMLSSGNPARNFFGMDTSYQLDASMIKALVDYDVNYVGRYLTGSVGSGESERDKNLTRTEAQNIVDAGLKLVPIYQDNTPSVDYFTYNQGVSDAQSAVSAALNIGIPNGQTIYFAVDMDMTDDEITTAAIPYFQGIVAGISHYNIGVYGTRNVSSRVSHAVSSVLYSYVSNMSTGFSGNLGFSQPTNWAFDQFFEDGVGVGPLPALDRVAVSNTDRGVKNLVDSRTTDWVDNSTWSYIKNLISSAQLTLEGSPHTVINSPAVRMTVSYENKTSMGSRSFLTPTFSIKNGKVDKSFLNYMSQSNGIIGSYSLSNTLDKFTVGLSTGFIKVSVDSSFNFTQTQPGMHIALEVSNKNPNSSDQVVKNTTFIKFDIYINRNRLNESETNQMSSAEVEAYYKMIAKEAEPWAKAGLGVMFIIGLFLGVSEVGSAISAGGVAAAEATTIFIQAVRGLIAALA